MDAVVLGQLVPIFADADDMVRRCRIGGHHLARFEIVVREYGIASGMRIVSS
jgi:hypothetical protein